MRVKSSMQTNKRNSQILTWKHTETVRSKQFYKLQKKQTRVRFISSSSRKESASKFTHLIHIKLDSVKLGCHSAVFDNKTNKRKLVFFNRILTLSVNVSKSLKITLKWFRISFQEAYFLERFFSVIPRNNKNSLRMANTGKASIFELSKFE